MKRIIEWMSFVTILFAFGVAGLLCGIEVANVIADAIGRGFWQMCIIVPVLLVTASAVSVFLLLGMKKGADEMVS